MCFACGAPWQLSALVLIEGDIDIRLERADEVVANLALEAAVQPTALPALTADFESSATCLAIIWAVATVPAAYCLVLAAALGEKLDAALEAHSAAASTALSPRSAPPLY